MVWHRKGRFGLHTGQTLRTRPTKKYHCNGHVVGNSSKNCNEYAVVKVVKFYEPTREVSFDKNKLKLAVNDGELSIDDVGVIYTLNKHKRWLLPDLVKEHVEQLYWDDVLEAKHSPKSTKPCKKGQGGKDDIQLRYTVVERNVANNIDRHFPDCTGVTSSRPNPSSSTPQRKPRKRHAFVGDLKSKLTSDDDVEVCYEFLSPFPKRRWPFNRQLPNLTLRDSRNEWKKCKGRRSKWNWRSNLENDAHCLSNTHAFDDEVIDKEFSDYLDRASYFPLGAYIDEMLKSDNGRGKHSYMPVETNQAEPWNPVLYGKGDAIYVNREDEPFSRSQVDRNIEKQTLTELEPLIVDRKLTFSLLVEDISPDNLLQEFGSNYIEDGVSPRKFVVKSDLNGTLPNVSNDTEEYCMLFEVADSPGINVVVADVAVLVPKDDVMPHDLREVLESDLYSLSCASPLTVKALVDHATEKIISVVANLPRNSCSKKSTLSIAKVPVEFIHNVCERKPEICGVREAARYSMKRTGANDLPSNVNIHASEDECDVLYCEICFLNEDGQQNTEFTSLRQCSHRFCNDCWTMYIMSCIGLGQSCITCPHFECKTVIGEAIVWSRTNSDTYRRYTKLKRQLVIDTNKQFRCCPAVDCTQMAFINYSTTAEESSISVPILCKCGQMWCFGCQKDAHWPASCEEAESFRKKWEDQDSLRKMYQLPGHISSVQVKRCPFCSHPMEKDRGCQHMSCRCGKGFCWECLRPWEDHNWDNCYENHKAFEDVELTFDYGNARFNKYSRIALENLVERSGKRLSVFRRLTRRGKQLDDVNEFVSFDLETNANRRLKRYAEKHLGTFLEQIFHFKYLAHLVLENTAAALAITRTKNMLKSLDRNMRMLDFIVGRLNEIFSKPEFVLSDEENLVNVELLLLRGKQLIRNIHMYTRARRHKQTKIVH